MTPPPPEPIGPHDLGGRPAGPVDRRDHDAAYWERQVDAMVMLLFRKDVMEDPAQLRRGIEALAPDAYDRLSYYERWAASAAGHCVARGLVTQKELDERIVRLRARRHP